MSHSLTFNVPSTLIGSFSSLPPRTKALLLATGAVTGWATWPSLAVFAHPVPPLLILGLGAMVGFLLTLATSDSSSTVFSTLSASWRGVVVVTIGVVLNDFFYLSAISRIGAAEANILHYLWPIFLCLIVALISRTMLRRWTMIGILVSFSGAVLAIGPQFQQQIDAYGLLFAFLGGITFAIYSAIRTFSHDKTDVVGPAMGVIAVVSLAGHALLEESIVPTFQQLVAIAVIGVIPLTLSTKLWDLATRTGHTSTISGIAYFNPIIALFLLSLSGASTVTVVTFIAAILIVVGAIVASK